jgi:hypothetical protein
LDPGDIRRSGSRTDFSPAILLENSLLTQSNIRFGNRSLVALQHPGVFPVLGGNLKEA